MARLARPRTGCPFDRRSASAARRGVAATEFAVILPIIMIFIVGLWEVGRMVEVQQCLNNAVREGARQASTGVKSTSDVKSTVVSYCQLKGLTAVTTSMVTVSPITNTAATDPSTATQLDQWRVSIAVPFSAVRWIALNQITSTATLNASADWLSMNDLPLTVQSSIPVK